MRIMRITCTMHNLGVIYDEVQKVLIGACSDGHARTEPVRLRGLTFRQVGLGRIIPVGDCNADCHEPGKLSLSLGQRESKIQ